MKKFRAQNDPNVQLFSNFFGHHFLPAKNDQLFQGWGFCVTAAGQPQACLVLPKHFVIPGTLSFLQIRGECSSIPADFVIPSVFVISSDIVIPTASSPAAFGVGAHSAGPSDFVIFQKYVRIFHEKVSGSE